MPTHLRAMGTATLRTGDNILIYFVCTARYCVGYTLVASMEKTHILCLGGAEFYAFGGDHEKLGFPLRWETPDRYIVISFLTTTLLDVFFAFVFAILNRIVRMSQRLEPKQFWWLLVIQKGFWTERSRKCPATIGPDRLVCFFLQSSHTRSGFWYSTSSTFGTCSN